MNLPLTQILFTLVNAVIAILLVVWWLRWTTRGLEWVTVFLVIAIGASFLSGVLFQVPPYLVGCEGMCPGWRGHPFPIYHIEPGGLSFFDPFSFVRNAFFYYAIILAYGAFVTWLLRVFQWPVRSTLSKLIFFLLVIALPLASTPLWLPPPQPEVTGEEQRIVINAARDWRWQLHLRSFMDRRLALEDMRIGPDGEHQRVCFRIYTWFYLPYGRTYLDMEPEGVRAIDGAEIPLSESCWTQP